MEQSEGEEQFGDRETGWKDRLNVPPPGKKTQQITPPPATPKPRNPDRAKVFHPPQIEHPLPAGLPPDITAEELAAIQAAAATVAQAAEESSAAKPDAGIVEPTEENAAETTPASFASAPQTAVDAAGLSTETTVAGDAYDKDAGGSVGMQAASITADSENAEQGAEVPSEKPSAPDADVMAAIASLAPADAQSASTSSAARAISSGPRWIAEPAPISDEDSTYVLEHEMEKTYAAIAAEEAGRAVATAGVAAAELKAADHPPEPPATQAEAESEHTAAPSSSDSKAESAAIASIVDSVLAELKPKLVEEIAKKMSRDRKK